MKLRKSAIGLLILSIGTVVSFAGALSATLAWFAYSTTINVQMKGTAVSETEQLQVGLKTNYTFPDSMVTQYKLTTVSEGGQKYVFAAPGTGFDSALINEYLRSTGYATNALVPVTSKKYNAGEDLSLYTAPRAGHPEIDEICPITQYVKIPFAFRVVRTDRQGNNTYAQRQNIWISNAKAIADNGSNNIYKAVRVFFDGKKYNELDLLISNKFIFNPSATAANDQRYTNVAGLLNLNDDDYFDMYDGAYGVDGTEIIYGDYDGSLPPTTHIDNDSAIEDVNGTGNDSEITTFTAKHMGGNNVYTSLAGITPHKANYKTLADIKPSTDANGFLYGGDVLTVTSETTNAIADLEATVYIEGWDHSVINQEAEHKFFLGMTFEINRVA